MAPEIGVSSLKKPSLSESTKSRKSETVTAPNPAKSNRISMFPTSAELEVDLLVSLTLQTLCNLPCNEGGKSVELYEPNVALSCPQIRNSLSSRLDGLRILTILEP